MTQRKKKDVPNPTADAVPGVSAGVGETVAAAEAALTISAPAKTAAKTRSATAPSPAQRRYLVRGLGQPGGKLSLFDEDGQEVPAQTVESCIARGWAERWFDNPTKRNWTVARLTPAGYRAIGHEPPGAH